MLSIKNKVISTTIEKINTSKIFHDEIWNIDNEIENFEELMNFHCLSIMENFINNLKNEFIQESFEDYKKKTEELFSEIDSDYWQKQQNIYNLFLNKKEENLYEKIKSFIFITKKKINMSLGNYELKDEEILKIVSDFRAKFYELIVDFYKENLKNIHNHYLSS